MHKTPYTIGNYKEIHIHLTDCSFCKHVIDTSSSLSL
uniref:Uncharacterized protein n=1 Tax=Arundo donax TaxID=35708 RepID=A0A0A9GLR7_ARUDO